MYGLFIFCLFGDKDKDSVNTFFSSNNSFVTYSCGACVLCVFKSSLGTYGKKYKREIRSKLIIKRKMGLNSC